MLINDYNIRKGEALFIDDFEDNLDLVFRKNLNVIMLDGENKKNSKYKRISNLGELEILVSYSLINGWNSKKFHFFYAIIK